MKCAIIQFKPEKGLGNVNYNRIIQICEAAISEGAQLLHLPEMCLVGYIWPNRAALEDHLEPKEGKTFQLFAKFCKSHQVYLAYGFAEIDEQGRAYNSQNLIGPEGNLLAHYRKRHLFNADLAWASPGNLPFQTVETPLGRIGLGICMDLNFDDFVQHHFDQGTEILLLAVNWLDEGGIVQNYWTYRLHPYRGHCLIANSYGSDGSFVFCGRSSHFDRGSLQKSLPPAGNHHLLVHISK